VSVQTTVSSSLNTTLSSVAPPVSVATLLPGSFALLAGAVHATVGGLSSLALPTSAVETFSQLSQTVSSVSTIAASTPSPQNRTSANPSRASSVSAPSPAEKRSLPAAPASASAPLLPPTSFAPPLPTTVVIPY
jgi:hypothetical protein